MQKHRQWQCTVLPIFEVREAKGQVSGSFQYPQSDGRSNQVLSFVFLNSYLRCSSDVELIAFIYCLFVNEF